jgi:integrase
MEGTAIYRSPLSPESLNDHFKACLALASLPKTTRFHDLRHTCATLMIQRNIHPRIVMDILGHSQIATTMNTYAHVLPKAQREAVDALDTLFVESEQNSSEEDAAGGA